MVGVVTISQLSSVNPYFALQNIEIPNMDLLAVFPLSVSECHAHLLFGGSTPGKLTGRPHVDNEALLIIKSWDCFLGVSRNPGAQQVVLPGSQANTAPVSPSLKFAPNY